MSHIVIKFEVLNEDGQLFKQLFKGEPSDTISDDDAYSWHLPSKQGDGEGTACGQIYSDYLYKSKTVKRGGITCLDCLGTVKEFKAIKL